MYNKADVTILVVDDNPMNLEVLHHALYEEGYTIRVEMDGEQAIEQVQAYPPHLILLDVMLPGINGFEVCHRLKSDPQSASIPIIFMTALSDTSDKVRGLQSGAVDYITKPFQKEEVLARIELQLQLRYLTTTLEHQNLRLKTLTEQLEQRVDESSHELSRSLAQLRLQDRAIAASNNGIVIVDAQQKDCPMIFVNPAFERITGYSSAEVVGKNCRFLQGTQTQQPGLQKLRKAIQQGTDCTVYLKNFRKDGTLFWNELSISPIYEKGKLTHFIGIQTDITERKQAEEQLQRSLRDKELLLKEIHHRVKNNLLVVSNLLELQSDYVDDEQIVHFFEESQNRIHSMALIHEQLYQSKDLEHINLGDYLESLIEHLIYSLDVDQSRIQIQCHIESIAVNIETATPCGLIVSELIANIFEHAFPDERLGQVLITVQQLQTQEILVQIQDDGIGLPADFAIETQDSLGLQLVSLLTQQLQGKLRLSTEGGTCFSLTFCELNYQSRMLES